MRAMVWRCWKHTTTAESKISVGCDAAGTARCCAKKTEQAWRLHWVKIHPIRLSAFPICFPASWQKQMEKRGNEVVEGEDLNILVGSIPLSGEEKEVKKQILQLLKEKYNIEETDFISAELEAVPAGNARNYGLDESMIMGYGQDDRVCHPSYRAMFELDKPQYTCVCLLVDKEEIGSVGATGMHSRFFENAVAEIMDAAEDYSELKVRRALQSSRMLSSDVSAAYDPNYPAVMEKKNSAFFGKGLTFNKFKFPEENPVPTMQMQNTSQESARSLMK